MQRWLDRFSCEKAAPHGRDENIRPLYYEGTVEDITKRKQVEEALHQSEAELRALFASMHDVVLVIDRNGVYCKIAPTNPDLLIKSPKELLGKTLRDVFPPEQAKNFSGFCIRS